MLYGVFTVHARNLLGMLFDILVYRVYLLPMPVHN